MTKPKYNRRVTHSRPWAVRLNPEVIEYLCAPTKFGASRLAAYLDLLSTAAETTTPYKPLYGRTFDLHESQLVIAITDLAERWDWARETVRKFLDQMEQFHLLSKEQLDRCSLLTMTIEWLDAGYSPLITNPVPTFEMPQSLSDKMDEWLSGDIADAELLEAIAETKETFDCTEVNMLPHTITTLQYALIRQLVSRWASSKQSLPPVPDSYCTESLQELFQTTLSGNWGLWLRLLREYSPGISPENATSQFAKEPAFINDGREILDSVFDHLKVDFTRNGI